MSTSVGGRSASAVSTGELFLRTLYDEHGGAMLSYARRLTGEQPAAEDVVQEALLRAWRNADVLTETRGSVRGWLLTVVRNLVIDRARARSARPREVPEAPDTVAVHHDHAEQVVDSVVVQDALAGLPEGQRVVLVELYFRGRTVAQTAALLGVAPGTVKSRCHYAMATLRRRLTASTAAGSGLRTKV